MEDSSKKQAILLAACGSKTFQFIRSLTEEDPTSKPYNDIVQLVMDNYDPKPSFIVQRYKINSRVRGTDESISNATRSSHLWHQSPSNSEDPLG